MKERPFLMDVEDRSVVLDVLVQSATHREWTLHSAHLRTTHVHLVISAEEAAAKLLGYLKARASHRLKLYPRHESRVRFWTHHGSTLYLWSLASISAANDYVLDQQGERLTWYCSFGAQSEATGS